MLGTAKGVSNIYETAAWGRENDPAYLNQVLFFETRLSASDILEFCLSVEKKMGRYRQTRWESRSIDIDLLFYNDAIIQEVALQIPHPYLHQRRFVLTPLAELAPDFIHPVLRKSIKQLLQECEDPLACEIYTLD